MEDIKEKVQGLEPIMARQLIFAELECSASKLRSELYRETVNRSPVSAVSNWLICLVQGYSQISEEPQHFVEPKYVEELRRCLLQFLDVEELDRFDITVVFKDEYVQKCLVPAMVGSGLIPRGLGGSPLCLKLGIFRIRDMLNDIEKAGEPDPGSVKGMQKFLRHLSKQLVPCLVEFERQLG